MDSDLTFSDLQRMTTCDGLLAAFDLVSGVDLLDVSARGGRIQANVVERVGDEVRCELVEAGTLFGEGATCTCGRSSSERPSSPPSHCPHAAAVLVRHLADCAERPEVELRRMRAIADAAASLRAGWLTLVRELAGRGSSGDQIHATLAGVMETAGLNDRLRAPLDVLRAALSPEQYSAYLVALVDAEVMLDAPGAPLDVRAPRVRELVWYLDQRMGGPGVEALDALLMLARAARTGTRTKIGELRAGGGEYLELMRLLWLVTRADRRQEERVVRAIVDLELGAFESEVPLAPSAFARRSPIVLRAVAEEVEDRMRGLWSVAVSSASVGPRTPLALAGPGLSPDSDGRLVLEDEVVPLRLGPDSLLSADDAVRRAMAVLMRLRAELRFAARDESGFRASLRSWRSAPLGEYFIRARFWGAEVQALILELAIERGEITWDAPIDLGGLLDDWQQNSWRDVNAVSTIYGSPVARRLITVIDLPSALRSLAPDLGPERLKSLFRLALRRGPNMADIGSILGCWHELGLPGSPESELGHHLLGLSDDGRGEDHESAVSPRDYPGRHG